MKLKKVLIAASLLATLGLTSCNTQKRWYGEYSESVGKYTYTTRVYVYTQADTITKVVFAENSNHHADGSYWGNASKWLEAQETVLTSFEGKSVKEIKNSELKKDEEGNEYYVNNVYDNVAGATLTSKRVYKAVVNALNNDYLIFNI